MALQTVLWAVLRKYRKWPFSTLHRIVSLEPINTKVGTFDCAIGPPRLPKPIKISQAIAYLRMSEIVGYTVIFPTFFSGTRTADAGCSTPRILHQSMQFGPSMCLLWVLKNFCLEELSPKNSQFGGGNRDFKLNCRVEELQNGSTDLAISS